MNYDNWKLATPESYEDLAECRICDTEFQPINEHDLYCCAECHKADNDD